MRTAFAITVFMAGLCLSDRWPELATEALTKARGAFASQDALTPPLRPEGGL